MGYSSRLFCASYLPGSKPPGGPHFGSRSLGSDVPNKLEGLCLRDSPDLLAGRATAATSPASESQKTSSSSRRSVEMLKPVHSRFGYTRILD